MQINAEGNVHWAIKELFLEVDYTKTKTEEESETSERRRDRRKKKEETVKCNRPSEKHSCFKALRLHFQISWISAWSAVYQTAVEMSYSM